MYTRTKENKHLPTVLSKTNAMWSEIFFIYNKGSKCSNITSLPT